jgi:hypothetical protein
MRINRLNALLAALLVVQVIAAVVAYAAANTPSAVVQTGTPLISSFASDSIAQIALRDGDKNEVVLAKDPAGAWTLPGADGYPVDAAKVNTLLTSLQGMTTTRLIAENKSSHAQLKVASDAFERSIQMVTSDGKTLALFIGSSVGGSATHVRLADQDQVYLVSGIQTWQIPAQAGQWVNTSYFSVPQEEIVGVRVQNANGTFEFNNVGGVWSAVGLPDGAAFDAQSITGLLPQLAALNLSAPLGKQSKEEYGLAAPSATVTLIRRRTLTPTPLPTLTNTPLVPGGLVTDTPAPPPTLPPSVPAVEDTLLTLVIGAKRENSNYVVKASTSDYVVEVAAFSVEGLVTLTREKLVLPTPVPSATPTPTPTIPVTATPVELTVTPATFTATPSLVVAASETPTSTPTTGN